MNDKILGTLLLATVAVASQYANADAVEPLTAWTSMDTVTHHVDRAIMQLDADGMPEYAHLKAQRLSQDLAEFIVGCSDGDQGISPGDYCMEEGNRLQSESEGSSLSDMPRLWEDAQ